MYPSIDTTRVRQMSDMAQAQGQSAEAQAEGTLLDQVMAQTRLAPSEEGYDIARQGVAAFIAELLQDNEGSPQVNKAVVDRMIIELDARIGSQVDEILHEIGRASCRERV